MKLKLTKGLGFPCDVWSVDDWRDFYAALKWAANRMVARRTPVKGNTEEKGAAQMMRAKLKVSSVEQFEIGERLKFNAVAASGYPSDGTDENNTYAKFTPLASLEMFVNNPALQGQIKPGQSFYVDFTLAE